MSGTLNDVVHDAYVLMRRVVDKAGVDQHAQLSNGLRLVLGKRGPATYILTLIRSNGPLRTVDEILVRHKCPVPMLAIRQPETGTLERITSDGTKSRYIAWRWEE